MGILGPIKLKPRTARVFVGESEDGQGVEFVLRAPRLEELTVWDTRFPDPVPPVKRDHHGQPVVMRDSEGKPMTDPASGVPLYVRDREAQSYRDEERLTRQGRLLCMVLECLVSPKLQPNTRPEDHDDERDYYQAVWHELEEAGLNVGTLNHLDRALGKLSKPMSDDEVKAARAALGVQDADAGDPKKGK